MEHFYMKTLYSYNDYRLFLKERLQTLKRTDRSFTYTTFAALVGFKSPGFLTQVLQGKSNLTPDMARRFAAALNLCKSESGFFVNLVASNQARTHEEKSASAERLLSAKPPKVKQIEKAQFEFYKKWYYSAIRSLLGYYAFDGDYEKLGRQLSPQITAAEAKKAVKLLLKLGIIEQAPDGRMILQDQLITTGADHQSVAVINYQLEAMDLAKRAVQELTREKRSAVTLTLGVSAEGRRLILERITALRKELMDIAAAETDIDRIMQINLHAFPLTEEKPEDL
jgi:uncharacterized protein (TIGR02147 family)